MRDGCRLAVDYYLPRPKAGTAIPWKSRCAVTASSPARATDSSSVYRPGDSRV